MKRIHYFLFPWNLKPLGKATILRPNIKELNELLKDLNLNNKDIHLYEVENIRDITKDTYIIYNGGQIDWKQSLPEHITQGMVSGFATANNAAGIFTEIQFVEHIGKINNSHSNSLM